MKIYLSYSALAIIIIYTLFILTSSSQPQSRLIYVKNSPLFLQICYPYNHQNIDGAAPSEQLKQKTSYFLPQVIQKGSYMPGKEESQIIKKKFGNQIDNIKIRCYQIFEKSTLMEELDILSPVRQQRHDQRQQTKGAIKFPNKQTKYLYQQYIYKKWLHNFSKSVQSMLSKQSPSYSLQSLIKFQFSLSITSSQSLSQLASSPILTIASAPQLFINNQHQFSMDKKLEGRGLHQVVALNFEMKDGRTGKYGKKQFDITQENCYIQLTEVIPQNMYIDVDQLKSKNIKVIVIGQKFIDVQRPSYLSKQYQYKLSIPLSSPICHPSSFSVRHYTCKIPIHFRYETPYSLQIKSSVSSPSKTTGLPSSHSSQQKIVEYVQVPLYPSKSSSLICQSNSRFEVPFQENYLTDRGEGFVPVGDGRMKSLVSMITIGSQVLVAVLLVRLIRK